MYNDLLLKGFVPPVDDDDAVQDLIDEMETLENLLSPEAQTLARDLRPYLVTDDVYDEIDENALIT